jgi:hypothetical protein
LYTSFKVVGYFLAMRQAIFIDPLPIAGLPCTLVNSASASFSSLHGNLVLACYLAALFDKSEYRVFHAGIMDSQPWLYSACYWCV